jgi:hypothetical protein
MTPPLKPRSPYGEGRRRQYVDVTRDGKTRKEIRVVGSLTGSATTFGSPSRAGLTALTGDAASPPGLPAPVANLLTPTHLYPSQLVELPAGATPDPNLVTEVANRRWGAKPAGGLWTATRTGATTSTWTEWRENEQYGHHGQANPWVIHLPDDGVHVLRIDTADDLQTLVDHFEVNSDDDQPRIDYEALAATGVHGIWLTDAGQTATRFSEESGPDLYGWDMECTLWFSLPDGTTFTPAT